jgi:hypothetical protein
VAATIALQATDLLRLDIPVPAAPLAMYFFHDRRFSQQPAASQFILYGLCRESQIKVALIHLLLTILRHNHMIDNDF